MARRRSRLGPCQVRSLLAPDRLASVTASVARIEGVRGIAVKADVGSRCLTTSVVPTTATGKAAAEGLARAAQGAGGAGRDRHSDPTGTGQVSPTSDHDGIM